MATAEPDILNALDTDLELKRIIAHANVKNVARQLPARVDYTANPADYDVQHSIVLALLQANGMCDVPTQQVEVEYIGDDQKLVLPAGLAMSDQTNAEVVLDQNIQVLVDILTMNPVNHIHAAVSGVVGLPAIRAALTALPVSGVRIDDSPAYVVGGHMHAAVYTSAEVATIIGRASSILQLNFDARDFQFLADAANRTPDNAWADPALDDPALIKPQLKPYTLACIAALNLPACGGVQWAAYTRAMAVSLKLLHTVDSALAKEYRFVVAMPPVTDWNGYMQWYRVQSANVNLTMIKIAVNLISVFGLQHLHRDHTYKPNDRTMERSNESYIQAMRTAMPREVLDIIQANKELFMRTAIHPIGLAQTYYCAKVLGRAKKIAEPLQIRIKTTPPPVQRIMIARAATKEWAATPVGISINEVYVATIAAIDAEVAKILTMPPAYSGLYKYYGVTRQAVVSEDALSDANALLPLVVGYAEMYHKAEDGTRDGLALALSLSNVTRDFSALAKQFVSMWATYSDDALKAGLEQYLMQAKDAMRNAAGGT